LPSQRKGFKCKRQGGRGFPDLLGVVISKRGRLLANRRENERSHDLFEQKRGGGGGGGRKHVPAGDYLRTKTRNDLPSSAKEGSKDERERGMSPSGSISEGKEVSLREE